jgi:hypothetical protein
MPTTNLSDTTRPPCSDRAQRQRANQRQERRPAMLRPCILLLTLATTAACGGSTINAQSGPPSSTVTVPSGGSPSASASGPEGSHARADVVAKVHAYEHTLDELAMRPNVSLDRLYRVATQPDVTEEIAFLNRFRSRGDRQEGWSRVASARVDGVVVAGPADTDRVASAAVKICLYVAHVRAVDRKGKSIIEQNRQPYYLTHLKLLNPRYPARTGWLVTRVSAIEEPSCAV